MEYPMSLCSRKCTDEPTWVSWSNVISTNHSPSFHYSWDGEGHPVEHQSFLLEPEVCKYLLNNYIFCHSTTVRTTQSACKTFPRFNKSMTGYQLVCVQSRVNVLHQMTETKISEATRKWGGSGESWSTRGREGGKQCAWYTGRRDWGSGHQALVRVEG